MATHDAKAYVHLDFYSILDVNALSDQKDIDKSWRKFALKYHPDKVTKDKAADAEVLYDQGRIGKEILSDPTTKQIYDDARAARERRRQQDELLDARTRKLKDDLLRREQGVKRSFDAADEDEATKLERDVRRIALDGKRRRLEKERQLREERQRKREEREKAKEPEVPMPVPEPIQPVVALPDIDRTVRARFKKTPVTQTIDSDQLTKMFSTFGSIEHAFIMTDKRVKLPGSREKTEVGRCGVVFKSILASYEAVEEWQKEKLTDPIWDEFLDVTWGGGTEPDCIANIETVGEQSASVLTAEEQVMIRMKKASLKKRHQETESAV